MENTKKLPLWARIIAVIVVTAFDNAFIIAALVALLVGESASLAFAFLVYAFFLRLTEIRDAIRSSQVSVNVNHNTTHEVKAEAY